MTAAAQQTEARFSPWRAVVGFGVVSLAADMVYEGARSVTGPLLASLGASAVLVGLVTGAGEAAALVLRLVFGPLADRSGRYWTLTLAGYTLTAVCVPLLAVTPFLGGAGLTVACVLLLAERTGKAIRSPSKSALLAQAAAHVGMGRGLGVHKALDQVGAFAGPLLVAALIAVTGAIWPAMLALAVPGAVAVALLFWLRGRIPDTASDPAGAQAPGSPAAKPDLRDVLRAGVGSDLPKAFFRFAYSSAATTAGLVTFGVISFHLTTEQLLPVAAIPVVYAAGMAAAAVAALVTGFSYDRHGGRSSMCFPSWSLRFPHLRSRRWPPSPSSGCSSGGRQSGCRTPPSRRWSPTSCPALVGPPRTACSRPSKAVRPSSAGASPATSTRGRSPCLWPWSP